MQENLFEYRYEDNDEYLLDYLKFVHFRMPSRIVYIVICLLFVLYFTFFAVYYTANQVPGTWYYWVGAFGFGALYLFLFVFGYKRDISLAKKRRSEMFGNTPVVYEAYVTDSEVKIVNTANHAETVFALSSVVKVYETKTIIVLKTGGRLMSLFSKDGFTKGTAEEFVDFLHKKGIK